MASWRDKLVTPVAIAVVACLAIGGVTAFRRTRAERGIEVTAHFVRTVGLYPGSSVRVLGVVVGTVKEIVPDGATVIVKMRIYDDVRIPADARALIIPPSLVSDRYVQLHPVYTAGAVMRDRADIPTARTRIPVELDDVLASLDSVFTALGPNGADATGNLQRLIDTGAKALGDGGGLALNDTITNLASVIGTLGDGRSDLTGVLESLSTFTNNLARNDAGVERLTRDLGTVAQNLAAERKDLERALANLSIALGEIASVVREHKSDLIRDVDSLAKATSTLLNHRDSLIEALDDTPLLISNLEQVFNTERHTLDIRQDNEQGGHPYDIFVCQLLAPLLNITCPPSPAAAPAARPRPGSGPDSLDRFTLVGMFGGRR